MRTVVIENDNKMPDGLRKYIAATGDETTYLYNAAYQKIEAFKNAFVDNDVILFFPTLISRSQYQGLMMVLWGLIQEGECKVKEVHVFGMGGSKEDDFKTILMEKDDYLKEVLEHVKVFHVGGPNFYKELEKDEMIF